MSKKSKTYQLQVANPLNVTLEIYKFQALKIY